MSVLLVLTTVNNSVPTLQEAITVDVTLDMSCWLMDTSVEVIRHTHTTHMSRSHPYYPYYDVTVINC